MFVAHEEENINFFIPQTAALSKSLELFPNLLDYKYGIHTV